MSILNELITQIENPDLRMRIAAEAEKLSKQKKFGLVFEEHLPECTPLWDIPIKEGSKVALKTGYVSDFYTVLKIENHVATCLNKDRSLTEKFGLDELVSIAEFGEPIYPYLKPIDTVCSAPNSDLWHTLIEADNYHALQLLDYLYTGKVDCIYIDPPYNTGARDWKYNNDYVDNSDQYRHSKWLSMMEKRLKLAKKLLTEDGVLIIAIDDYEEAHLILLLEELFPEYDISPIIVNHHPQGGAADNISRTHEYAIFVTPKGKKVIRGKKSEDLEESWSLTRGGTDVRNLRRGRPNSFYAIYVNDSTHQVVGVGPHLDADTVYDPDEAPEGCSAFYPVGKDGTERVWRYERESMQKHIEAGDIICTSRMTLNVVKRRDVKYDPVFSVWSDGKYNAGTFGTNITYEVFGGSNRFSYPKSLYTVEDCINFVVQDNKNALVVDFFAGSGTTLHAVALLNSKDGGHRRCILVTNNEVSDAEAKELYKSGIKPGDEKWEALGIARYVTWPRIVCVIEGHDINGKPLKGNYLGCEILMKDGLKTNANFFKLGFLDKNAVALGRQFKEMLPTLWMKAGAIGTCPTISDDTPDMLLLPKNHFAILVNEKKYLDFVEKLELHPEIETIYIVTDSESGYRDMISGLNVKDSYQLYRDFIDNFRINSVRR